MTGVYPETAARARGSAAGFGAPRRRQGGAAMKVLVLLDVAADVRIPPERDPRSGRVREDRLVREVDPAGARALDLALALTADRPNGQVTVIHLGPAENEDFLRQALARGCQQAIRVWDEEAARGPDGRQSRRAGRRGPGGRFRPGGGR